MTLRGWKEITQHTGLSAKMIKQLAERKENPFPLIRVARKYMTTKKLFQEWIEAEVMQKS